MRRGGVKSFVDDLVLGRGVVISRAATSLRSVETQPLTRRFVRSQTNNISFITTGQRALSLLFSLHCKLSDFTRPPLAAVCLAFARFQRQKASAALLYNAISVSVVDWFVG